MAGVLEQLIRPQQKTIYQDRKAMELEAAIHTCVICGHTMSSAEYEEKGCIFCGADSEEVLA